MNTKSDRIIGLTGGLLQTMYESFVGIFASTIDYGCRITGDMVKTGGTSAADAGTMRKLRSSVVRNDVAKRP